MMLESSTPHTIISQSSISYSSAFYTGGLCALTGLHIVIRESKTAPCPGVGVVVAALLRSLLLLPSFPALFLSSFDAASCTSGVPPCLSTTIAARRRCPPPPSLGRAPRVSNSNSIGPESLFPTRTLSSERKPALDSSVRHHTLEIKHRCGTSKINRK